MAKIELMNSIFDRDNDNVLKFNNKEERDNYFNAVADKVVFENVNFNAGDLINTQIELNVNGLTSLFKLLNYNYCVVTQEEEKLFYFVERSEQLDGSLISLRLSCDLFQTYFYDIENLQGLITRTHLDRFVKSGELWKYNNQLDSPLFEREGMEFAKRPSQKAQLFLKTENEAIGTWLKENVLEWNYYFLTPTDFKNVYNTKTGDVENLEALNYITKNYAMETGELICLVEPVLRAGKRISIETSGGSLDWTNIGISHFLEKNNGTAYVKAIKKSVLSPFTSNKMTHISIGGDENVLVIDAISYSTYINVDLGDLGEFPLIEFFKTGDSADVANYVIGCVEFQDLSNYVLQTDENFFVDEFVVKNITNETEPKLLSEEVTKYNIFCGGQTFELPLLKTSRCPKFRYWEPLTPDITKAVLAYSNELSEGENGVYSSLNETDFSGMCIQIDLSKWFATDQLDLFLANNKNNLQIFNNTLKSERQTYASNSIFGAVRGAINPTQLIGEGVAIMQSGANLAISQGYRAINYDLTLDNMAQAPDQVSSINSNSVLVSAVSGIGIFIEKQEPLPFEQQIFIDKLKMMGYNFGKLGNLNEYLNSRTYYNYIQAIVYEIDGNFAEQVKDGLKEIFAKGVRVWHSDTWTGKIDYNLNNKERMLANG